MKNELLKPALIELRAAPKLPDIAYDKSIIKKDVEDNRHKFRNKFKNNTPQFV